MRPQPALDGFKVHLLAIGVVFDLVLGDLGDREVFGFRMGEINAADRRGRRHRVGFGEFDTCGFFGIEKF